MSRSACLLIGGAAHFKHKEILPGGCTSEQQRRMMDSTLSDLDEMQKFASQVVAVNNVRGRLIETKRVAVSNVLLNKDIAHLYHTDANITKTPYENKDEVREFVCKFLKEDIAETLILFLTGHGSQLQPVVTPVQESFLLPAVGPFPPELYTDSELTRDIMLSLPNHKTLYVIIHACHSAGMLNFWQIDAGRLKVALFASAEADAKANWQAGRLCTDEEDRKPGFVEVFCKAARKGEPLCNIAKQIVEKLQKVEESVRPRFLPSTPEMAAQSFLC